MDGNPYDIVDRMCRVFSEGFYPAEIKPKEVCTFSKAYVLGVGFTGIAIGFVLCLLLVATVIGG